MPVANATNKNRTPALLLLCLMVVAASGGRAQSSPAPTPEDNAIRLTNEGRYIEAHQEVTQLIREADSRPGAGLVYRAALYQLLGAIENSLGHFQKAERAVMTGLEISEREATPPSVLVALWVQLAESYTLRARYKEAKGALQHAFETAEAGLPADHPRRATVFDSFGFLALAEGQSSRAEAWFRRSLDLLEKKLGPSNPDVAHSALTLASILESTGRLAEAIPLIERSSRALRQAYGAGNPGEVFANLMVATAQLDSAPAEAERVLRDALAAWLTTQPEVHPTTSKLLNALGAARYRQGDLAEALALNGRALTIFTASLGPEHPQVVSAMYDRARLLAAAKRKKEAAALKKEADRIRVAKGYAEPGRHSIDIRSLRAR